MKTDIESTCALINHRLNADGVTKYDIALMCGVSYRNILEICNGTKVPSQIVARVYNTLSTHPHEGGEEIMVLKSTVATPRSRRESPWCDELEYSDAAARHLLGRMVAQMRHHLGMSQNEVAMVVAGTNQSTISNFERGYYTWWPYWGDNLLQVVNAWGKSNVMQLRDRIMGGEGCGNAQLLMLFSDVLASDTSTQASAVKLLTDLMRHK